MSVTNATTTNPSGNAKGKKVVIGIIAVVVVAVIGIVFTTRNRNTSDRQDIIKIGAILPLTGPAAVLGKEVREGVELAIEQLNQKIDNKIILKCFYEDSANDPKTAITAYQKLTTLNNVDVIFTCMSNPSKALAERIKSDVNSKPMIVTLVAPTDFPKSSKKIFRINYVAQQEAEILTEFITKKEQPKTYFIYYSTDDYGRDLLNEFSSAINKTGAHIAFTETYERGEIDHRSALEKIKASNSDCCLFIGNSETVVNAILQAFQLGYNKPIYAPCGFAFPPYWERFENVDSSVYFTIPKFELSVMNPDEFSNNKLTKEFIQSFSQKYRYKPSYIAAFSYSAIEIIHAASLKNDKSLSLETKMESVQNLPSVSGSISVDENGDVRMDTIIMKLHQGDVYPVE